LIKNFSFYLPQYCIKLWITFASPCALLPFCPFALLAQAKVSLKSKLS